MDTSQAQVKAMASGVGKDQGDGMGCSRRNRTVDRVDKHLYNTSHHVRIRTSTHVPFVREFQALFFIHHGLESAMSVYVILDIEVNDWDAYAEYQERVAPLIEKWGGRYVVRGGETTVLEGDWKPSRLVVLEFPSRERLQGFATSAEYAPVAEIRHRAARTNGVVVDGYAGHE